MAGPTFGLPDLQAGMHAHDRAVDQGVFEVGLAGHDLEQPLENTSAHPAPKTLEHRVPATELIGQIPPGGTGSGHPEDSFDKQPIVSRNAAITRLAGQKGSDSRPLFIAQRRSIQSHSPNF
jgi:hypothetical protein